MKTMLGFLFAIFIFSSSAQALIYLEPFAGVQLGSTEIIDGDAGCR